MLKKVLVTLVLTVGVIAILRVKVDAHLEGYVYTPTIRHIASYDCTVNIEQVRNLEQHQALFRCEAIATSFEVLCRNPNGRVTFGNNIQETVLVIGESELGEGNITDRDGSKATATVPVDDTDLLAAANQACKDRNRNWTLADEFVKEWDVYLRTYDLVDGDAIPAWAGLVHCTTPVNPANGLAYTLDPRVGNPPPGTPQNPVPTNYSCALVTEQHCDGIEPCLPSQIALRQGNPLEQRYALLAQPMKLARAVWNKPTM